MPPGGIIASMGARDDDRLIREMLATSLDDAVYALSFWLGRRSRLPFHRRAARRESERMIRFWQAQVVSGARRSPVGLLVSGGPIVRVTRLAIGYHVRRLLARLTIAVLVVMTSLAVVLILAGR
jgi:hypothetical protein